jgi:two-component system chemotaxis response regulator CheB
MDVQMPVMDGLEAVRRIMQERPTPVIVLSATVCPGEVGSAFRAVRAGAFEALPKPEGLTTRESLERITENLISRIKLYARVGRQRGWRGRLMDVPSSGKPLFPATSHRVVAIGASTGGPRTVQSLLAAIPGSFPSPILLVQHISRGFTQGFAEWLQRECELDIRVVERSEPLRPGTVYLSRDERHLEIGLGRAVARTGPPVNACRPSVDVLFRSVARECGGNGVAVLLTGMGRDGGKGALAVHKAGGEVIVQDERSSVVFGMPKAAIDLGAAHRVLPAEEIPGALAAVLTEPPVAAGEGI